MCDCVDFVYEIGFKICKGCGKTEKHLESTYQTCSYQQSHCPFSSGYSRNKRFAVLLKTILFPCPGKSDEKMLHYFFKNDLKPKVSEIENVFRTSGLNDKRYSSIHIFAKLFSPDYKPISYNNIEQIEKIIEWNFIRFEMKYKQKYDGFLSYNYIMIYLLESMNFHEYIPFIKETKCARRLKHYDSRVKDMTFSFGLFHSCRFQEVSDVVLNF